jgi:polar amino acid transport system substrate-binding protein
VVVRIINYLDTMLRLLLNRRVDLIVNSREVVLYNMKEKNTGKYNDIKVMLPPLSVNKLYIAFSNKTGKSKKYVKAFNAGLMKIKKSGKYDEILKKHGMD